MNLKSLCRREVVGVSARVGYPAFGAVASK
ncbi:hypothetical protein FHW64_006404 [Variovorax sp. Sphag1AA]|nr:hypothetical protein [Variovorax sp. Sphag1AA]